MTTWLPGEASNIHIFILPYLNSKADKLAQEMGGDGWCQSTREKDKTP
jgi:hypothetical protein